HRHAVGEESVNDSGRVLFRVPSTRMGESIFPSRQVLQLPLILLTLTSTSPVARIPARQFKHLQCELQLRLLIAPSSPCPVHTRWRHRTGPRFCSFEVAQQKPRSSNCPGATREEHRQRA
ncbi:hypothetical protein QBC45DRAFT_319422, partial [Copromyces sp. CBS 386.78]